MTQKPDEVTAKDSGSNFNPHPEGQFAMVCVDVVDLGYKVESYAGQSPFESPKVALVFVSGERHADEAKSLMLVSVEMTNSASDKANLRKFLESWRGKSYTPEQVNAGLPLHKLAGNAALISIEHVLTKRNKQFAKVRSVSPLPKGMPAVDEAIAGEYTRPKFLTDKKAKYAEDVAKFRGNGGEKEPELPPEQDDDDDLPF